MKRSILLFAATATLAACSPQENAGETSNDAATAAQVIADLGSTPDGPIYTKMAGETVALSGYDPVAYFGDAGATRGSDKFAVRYQGFDYHFANAENAAAFEAEPAKYAPQYGGYCAWAMGANNALAPGDPELYTIVDGKLYLNFSKTVQERWEKDIPGFIEKADANYPTHSPDEHYTTD